MQDKYRKVLARTAWLQDSKFTGTNRKKKEKKQEKEIATELSSFPNIGKEKRWKLGKARLVSTVRKAKGIERADAERHKTRTGAGHKFKPRIRTGMRN